MNEREVLSLLQETGAFLEGHFHLSSGLHSPQYVQCALALSFPDYAEKLAASLAEPFTGEGITLVVGPALGGIVLSQEVARALRARAIFAERTTSRAQNLSAMPVCMSACPVGTADRQRTGRPAQAGGTDREEKILSLRRGFRIEKQERVLVVEDVVTSGRSVQEIMEIAKEEGGIVKGIASLVDRSSGKVDFGVRWERLISLDLETYPPDRCPLCQEGIPLEKLGSR